MDHRTRKLMTTYKALHPRERRWLTRKVSRKEGRKGLTNIKESVHASTRRLHRKTPTRTDYSHQKQCWPTIYNRMTITRKQNGKKKLYGHLKRLINISHDKTWTWWLRKRNFKRETESRPNGSAKQRRKNQSYQGKNR